ncbi:hypothetical protein DFH08DRAFT_906152 [Mycena albidolilacea]|uniref:DUF6533 domain-containing protein n=1 Tax=Mycena albidolilacea TaxID=1033008 RepID=A0AAD7E891_9AGAR|nr:hypothetical protein DFH08DRAFT_906152 [Mycena albidolilacea]
MNNGFLESDSEMLQVLRDAQTTNSMIPLNSYDHIITFQDEVELMWKSSIHTTNVIYNRYFTLIALMYARPCLWLLISHILMLTPYKSNATLLVGLTSFLRCIRYLNSEAVSSTLILATVDFILVLRVWLLYEKARWLLYVLVPMIGCKGLVSHYTIYTTKVFWPLSYVDSLCRDCILRHCRWPLTGCYPLGLVPRYFTFYSLPVLVVSMTMFILTVYKCGRTLLTHGRARMPIYNLFLRDGAFWFVAIFITFLPEIVIWAAARQSLAELMIAVTSIIGSRVLLNIKRLKPPQTLPTTTAPTTLAVGTTIELDTIDYPSRIPWGTVGTITDGATLTVPSHETAGVL